MAESQSFCNFQRLLKYTVQHSFIQTASKSLTAFIRRQDFSTYLVRLGSVALHQQLSTIDDVAIHGLDGVLGRALVVEAHES